VSDSAEWVEVGEVAFGEAKRLKAILEDRGIELRLASDPDQCNSCSPKIRIALRSLDVERFQAFLREEHVRSLGDLVHAPELADVVFDPEQADATCPACGTVFSTKLAECPDCGLGFGNEGG
jgi:hypothetical protein